MCYHVTKQAEHNNIELHPWDSKPLICIRHPTTHIRPSVVRDHLKCDGTRAETRFRLTAKKRGPFKSAGGVSVQSTTGSLGMLISCSNAGYTMFRGSVKGTGYPLIRQFSLHFASRASPCAITFQLESTTQTNKNTPGGFHLLSLARPKPEYHSNKCSDTVNLTTQLMSYLYEVLPKKSGNFNSALEPVVVRPSTARCG